MHELDSQVINTYSGLYVPVHFHFRLVFEDTCYINHIFLL